MTQTIIWTIAILTVLGAALAVVLYVVAEKFKVEEDPRIDDVEKELPGANCGGCGQAGCRAFAQFCVESEDMEKCFCPVGGNAVMQKVASVLGREVAAKEPMVAVVRCNGNCENRPKTNEYGGYQSCRVKAALYSGDTGCSFGCLGCGDCVAACQFGAIEMDPATGLPVVDEEKCTACGACVKACPKSIIELRNKGRRNMRVYVSCVNKDKGAVANKLCTTSCIACGMCERTCKFDAIHVVDGVARIDYDKCKGCGMCAQKCPKHIILFPLKDDPNPPKPVVKPAAPAAAPAAKPEAKAEAKPETKAE